MFSVEFGISFKPDSHPEAQKPLEAFLPCGRRAWSSSLCGALRAGDFIADELCLPFRGSEAPFANVSSGDEVLRPCDCLRRENQSAAVERHAHPCSPLMPRVREKKHTDHNTEPEQSDSLFPLLGKGNLFGPREDFVRSAV